MYEPSDTPLFGETRRETVYAHWALAAVTLVLTGSTLITACSVGTDHHTGVHVFMSLCVIVLTGATALLAKWYNEGDLPPKILYFLYFQCGVLCVLAILLHVYYAEEAHTKKLR